MADYYPLRVAGKTYSRDARILGRIHKLKNPLRALSKLRTRDSNTQTVNKAMVYVMRCPRCKDVTAKKPEHGSPYTCSRCKWSSSKESKSMSYLDRLGEWIEKAGLRPRLS